MQLQQTDVDGQEVVRRLARHPRSAGLARAELRTVLAGWGLAALEDAALVAVSELVANAVRHAHASPGRQIATGYRREGEDGVRIEVHDAGEGRPRMQAVDADAEHGRGLALVAAVADRWGVSERAGAGKAVWAVLTAHDGCGDRRGA